MSQSSIRSAVRTLADIRDRCYVDEITGCWHWKGGTKVSGAPSMWIPAIRRASTMSQALCVVTKGRPLGEGEHWHCICSTKYCGNPAHNRSGDLSALRRSLGTERSPLFRAKVSESRRKNSAITDEQIAELRASSEPAEQVAARLGISQSYVNKLRSGIRRLPRDAAPGASVFNWRPA